MFIPEYLVLKEIVMQKLHLLALIPIVVFTARVAMAEPVDSGPPVQQQKNAVPDSTSSGNYLEDEAGTTVDGDTAKAVDKKAKKSKTNSLEKGKSHNKEPEKGGVEVK
jgi:hypothetical protein